MTVASELRDYADWLDSEEGWAMIKDKELGLEGTRRTALLWILDQQQEEDGQGVRLLRSAIMVWAAEQGYPLEDKRLNALVKAVLAGD
jgi:hypothetical protein